MDYLFPFGVDGEAVPDGVDTFAVQFGFLGAPVDRLEFHFHAGAFSRFPGQVDVEPDNLVVLVPEAHGGEVVIKADDHLFRAAAAAARKGQDGQDSQYQRK